MSGTIDTSTIDGLVDEILKAIPDTHGSVRVKFQLAEIKTKLVQWQLSLHTLNEDPALKEK